MEYAKQYRYELKYALNPHTSAILRQRAAAVLVPDAHSGGRYHISNLYFDDQYNTFYTEKQSGAMRREKLRVRHYNHDEATLRLECKHKEGQMVYKESIDLSPGEYAAMQRGDFGFAAARKEPFWRSFYARAAARGLRAVCTVEYDREAWCYGPGNVRLTFDSNLESSPMPGCTGFTALPPGCEVLELKYDRFLPSVVAQLLRGVPLQQEAVSKYTLARETLWGMQNYDR